MKDLPQMISTKDAAYLNDMFNWNIVTAKKFDHYLDLVSDEELEQKLDELIEMHLAFAEEIIQIMEGGLSQ